MEIKKYFVWGFLRISLGFIFFWAFIDKLFGLGIGTAPDKSWLSGVSPTYGFLKFGTQGPLKPLFENLAGNVFVDWLFMLGLFFIGTALIFGIAMRFTTYAGSLLLFLMWLSLLFPKNNPILDEHIIYILVLLGLKKVNAGEILGFGKWWKSTSIVKNLPFLE